VRRERGEVPAGSQRRGLPCADRTVAFAVGSDWNIVDAFHFAVSTLTATSIADPDLVLDDGWMKVFAVLYQLVGIGILVDILRRLGSDS
jgi:hypothetical protein